MLIRIFRRDKTPRKKRNFNIPETKISWKVWKFRIKHIQSWKNLWCFEIVHTIFVIFIRQLLNRFGVCRYRTKKYVNYTDKIKSSEFYFYACYPLTIRFTPCFVMFSNAYLNFAYKLFHERDSGYYMIVLRVALTLRIATW